MSTSSWEVFEPSDMYQTQEGVDKSVERLYVRELQDSVEWWAIVFGSDSVEVRYDEERVSLSVRDIVQNLDNISVSFRGGLSVNIDGQIGFEFDIEEAMLVTECDSLSEGVELVERRIGLA